MARGEEHLISSSSRKTNNCPGKLWHEGTKSTLETRYREEGVGMLGRQPRSCNCQLDSETIQGRTFSLIRVSHIAQTQTMLNMVVTDKLTLNKLIIKLNGLSSDFWTHRPAEHSTEKNVAAPSKTLGTPKMHITRKAAQSHRQRNIGTIYDKTPCFQSSLQTREERRGEAVHLSFKQKLAVARAADHIVRWQHQGLAYEWRGHASFQSQSDKQVMPVYWSRWCSILSQEKSVSKQEWQKRGKNGLPFRDQSSHPHPSGFP